MKKRIWEKRIFSFVTALALCLCLLPGKMAVNAADTYVSKWEDFEKALKDNATVIVLESSLTAPNDDITAYSTLLVGTANSSLTIKGLGDSKPVLTLPHMGVQLGSNVTLENLSVSLTNKDLKGIFTNGQTLTLKNTTFSSTVDLYTKTVKIDDLREKQPEGTGGDVTTRSRTAKNGSGNTIDVQNTTGIGTIYGGALTVTITEEEKENATEDDEKEVVTTLSPVDFGTGALEGTVNFSEDSTAVGNFSLDHIANLFVQKGVLRPGNMTAGVNVKLEAKVTLNLADVMKKNTTDGKGDFVINTLSVETGAGDQVAGNKAARWTERTLTMGIQDTLTVNSLNEDACFILALLDNGGNFATPIENNRYVVIKNGSEGLFALHPSSAGSGWALMLDSTGDKAWTAKSGLPHAKLDPGNASTTWVSYATLDASPNLISVGKDDIKDPQYDTLKITIENDMDGFCFYFIRKKGDDKLYTKAVRIKRDSVAPEFTAVAYNASNSVEITLTTPELSGISTYTVKDARNNPIACTTSPDKLTLYFEDLIVGQPYDLYIQATDIAGNESKAVLVHLTPSEVTSGNLATAEIDLQGLAARPVYNGKDHIPIVVVNLKGGIVPETAYTVSFSRPNGVSGDMASVGTITVTVTAKAGGKFSGTKSATFTIYPTPVKEEVLPEATAIEYGMQLNESQLTGGAVRINSTGDLNGQMVDGAWAWADQSVRPMSSGKNAAIFTPTNPNYETLTRDIQVTVKEVQPTTNLKVPSNAIAGQQVTVEFSCTNPNYVSLAGPPYTLSYQIGNGNVQALSSAGTFTIPANTPADTKITVIATTGVVSGQYLTKEVKATITVTNKTEVRIRDVDPDDAIYDGKPHVGYVGEPMVRRGYEGEFDIKYAGRDGTTYNSNVPPTNAGDYTVTFSVPDSDPTYRGSLTLEFTIEKREVTVRPRSLTVKLGSKAPTLELEFDNIADGENDLTPSAAPVFEITAEDATITDLKDVPNRDGVYDVKWRNINASTFRNSNNYEITKRGSGTITVKETVGWEILRKGSRYYTDVDEYLTGWQVMNNRQYYFDEAGYMATGWYQDEDMNWYLFSETGVMQTGWKQVGGRWYNMKSNGPMRTGWYCDNENRWYMLNRGSGAMQTGWVRDSNGAWYYCNSAGVMQTGWTYASGRWYNMRSDGVMRTGWYSDGRNWYYLGSDGAMRTGWNQIAGSWYYMGSDGRMYVNTRTPDGYRVNASGRMIGR